MNHCSYSHKFARTFFLHWSYQFQFNAIQFNLLFDLTSLCGFFLYCTWSSIKSYAKHYRFDLFHFFFSVHMRCAHRLNQLCDKTMRPNHDNRNYIGSNQPKIRDIAGAQPNMEFVKKKNKIILTLKQHTLLCGLKFFNIK